MSSMIYAIGNWGYVLGVVLASAVSFGGAMLVDYGHRTGKADFFGDAYKASGLILMTLITTVILSFIFAICWYLASP